MPNEKSKPATPRLHAYPAIKEEATAAAATREARRSEPGGAARSVVVVAAPLVERATSPADPEPSSSEPTPKGEGVPIEFGGESGAREGALEEDSGGARFDDEEGEEERGKPGGDRAVGTEGVEGEEEGMGEGAEGASESAASGEMAPLTTSEYVCAAVVRPSAATLTV